jgi:hypothetical protein
MTSRTLVLPWGGPSNFFSAVSFFCYKERQSGRFPKILLGFCLFCFKRFERKRTPCFYRTDHYFVRY